MKSQPKTAAVSPTAPFPRSGRTRRLHRRSALKSDAHVVVIAMPPVTTDATPPTDATWLAARASRRRPVRFAVGDVSSAPARRATRSAIAVTATAPIALATNALPYLPLPGVNGASRRGITIGARRLATPIVRLVIVSRRS